MPQYVRDARVRSQPLGSETMLFDDAGDRVHVLNDSSALLWERLAQPASIHELEALLRETYEVGPDEDVAAMVEGVLRALVEKGLVVTR